MKIKKLSEEAIIPSKAHPWDAGYDLYTINEDYVLKPMERKSFNTGISMAIPVDFFGRISPRSGLALKKGIDVLGGICDCQYRGEILVILINLGQEPVKICKFDKIAQIIIQPCADFILQVVNDLDSTTRNDKGFGSTDINSVSSKIVENIIKTNGYKSV